MNGRVNIMNSKGLSNYPLFESSHEIQDTNFLENIYESNDLQEDFFSSNNITYLHDEIVKRVHVQTNKNIKKQSNINLKIIMKSIYLQYGKNNKEKINEQIKVLNKEVLRYCVSDIVSNINLYLEYKTRVSTMPVPLEHPKNVSVTGTKSNINFVY